MQVTKQQSAARKIGEKESAAEDGAIGLASSRVYRLRAGHPVLFGVIAFVVGAFVLGAFTMTTYGNWAFEGVNLVTALWQVICGSLGGGIAAVIAAFAYAHTLRPTMGAMQADGITGGNVDRAASGKNRVTTASSR